MNFCSKIETGNNTVLENAVPSTVHQNSLEMKNNRGILNRLCIELATAS